MGKTLLISEIEVQKYLPMEEIIDSVEKHSLAWEKAR